MVHSYALVNSIPFPHPGHTAWIRRELNEMGSYQKETLISTTYKIQNFYFFNSFKTSLHVNNAKAVNKDFPNIMHKMRFQTRISSK